MVNFIRAVILTRVQGTSESMAEVIFSGPEGRLEGHYRKAREDGAPIALILHPTPSSVGR